MATALRSSKSTNRGRHGDCADRRKKSTHTEVSTRTSATGAPPVGFSERAYVKLQIEVSGRADYRAQLLAPKVVLQGDHEGFTTCGGLRDRLHLLEERLRKIDCGAHV